MGIWMRDHASAGFNDGLRTSSSVTSRIRNVSILPLPEVTPAIEGRWHDEASATRRTPALFLPMHGKCEVDQNSTDKALDTHHPSRRDGTELQRPVEEVTKYCGALSEIS
jgi:hypothetical protein